MIVVHAYDRSVSSRRGDSLQLSDGRLHSAKKEPSREQRVKFLFVSRRFVFDEKKFGAWERRNLDLVNSRQSVRAEKLLPKGCLSMHSKFIFLKWKNECHSTFLIFSFFWERGIITHLRVGISEIQVGIRDKFSKCKRQREICNIIKITCAEKSLKSLKIRYFNSGEL